MRRNRRGSRPKLGGEARAGQLEFRVGSVVGEEPEGRQSLVEAS